MLVFLCCILVLVLLLLVFTPTSIAGMLLLAVAHLYYLRSHLI